MSDTDSSARLVAQVKWFNPSSGYGFVTVKSNCDNKDEDIFVHHTSICVESNQYKYLKKGEYVLLTVEVTDSGKHKYQAVNVRGILEGKLMCEVLNEQSNENHNHNHNQNQNQNQNEDGWERQGRRRNHKNHKNHRHQSGNNRQQNRVRDDD